MILKKEELELLKECLEVLEETDSYDNDVYSDVKLAICTNEFENPIYLLNECKFYLDNADLYDKLTEYTERF